MNTIMAAPASCEVCAVIRFLHAEGRRAAEIHRRLCRVYGENDMSESLNKLPRSIQNQRLGILTKGVVLLYDNARPHTAAQTNASIKLFNWKIFDHPPYSPDLVPSDYHLFTKMKILLGTQRFHTNEKLMAVVNKWLHNLAAPFFEEGLQKLVSRYDKCLNVDDNYVEK
jgi:transposase